MGLYSRMTERASVWARTDETDTWACVIQQVPCSVTALSPQAARRESMLPDPEVTHLVRAEGEPAVSQGMRLRLDSDFREFVAKYVRVAELPRPGHTVIGVAAAKAVL